MKNGQNELIWVEWISKNFIRGLQVSIGQDITSKINVENKYESLVESANDFIFYTDLNGKFLFVNRKFRDTLGYTEEELIGRDSNFMVTDDFKDEVLLFYQNQFVNRTLNTYKEFKIRKKNGEEIWFGQNSNLQFEVNSEKIIKGFICHARDITARIVSQEKTRKQELSLKSNIGFASQIQASLYPKVNKFKECFSDYTLISSPKEIVSGDFYWLEKFENKTVFIFGDCSEHGVPGAFLTLIGINLLNQIVKENQILDPGSILNNLELLFFEKLESKRKIKGVSLSVLVFDKTSETLTYACAGSSFIVQEGKDLKVIQGDSKLIGVKDKPSEFLYNSYSLSTKSLDTYYFMTDGLQNQISSNSTTRFSLNRILDILKSNSEKSLKEKSKILQEKLGLWRGNSVQSDDITFISFKF